MTRIEKQIRQGLPLVGVPPYGQIHAHSTGNPSSTAQNEADYMGRKNINLGFFTHVVGNGRIIQTALTNRGAWDVGGDWNKWGYASVELIESHKTKAEFERDYKIYVNLLRDLAKEAKLPTVLDQGNIGIITHDYARRNQTNNKTDHTDPYPYLAKWGITKSQFKKDVEKGFVAEVKPPVKPNDSFNINNYHTTTPFQIIIKKADYAYKEKELKNKVGKILPKGSIFTVKKLVYAGKHPRYELVSGLFITTRKDTIDIYKAKSTSVSTTPSAPKPAPKPTPKPNNIGKWFDEKGKFYVGEQTPGGKNTKVNSLPLTANATGKGAKIADVSKGNYIQYDKFMNDGKYIWIRQPRGNGKFGYMATGNVGKDGKRVDYWGRFR